MKLTDYCADLEFSFFTEKPWESSEGLEESIRQLITELDKESAVDEDVAVHKTAVVEESATIRGPVIIGPGCFIGPHSLLRGGVILGDETKVGPSCEVKHSVIGRRTAFARFNFVGDSIIGSDVNLEAGAILANHYNEREDKTILALIDGTETNLGVTKFGALIGDESKIGANAVTSPGTILVPKSLVKRLELIEQC